MRSFILLLIFLGIAGVLAYAALDYLADLEPRVREIEEVVNPELFER